MSLNHIVVMGRLVRDPETRTTQSGVSVCNFTLAVDRDYKQGDEKIADFIDCVAWREAADFVSKYFSKGRMMCVAGPLQSRKWEDKEGNKRTSWEIQVRNVYFADSKRDGDNHDSVESHYQAPTPESFEAARNSFSEINDADGELPF